MTKTTETDSAPMVVGASKNIVGVVVALLLLASGVLIAVNALWAICLVIGLIVLVWTVVCRPHPSLILLALPLSLVAPPLIIIGIGARSVAVTLSDVVILVAVLAWAGRPIKVKRAWLAGNLVLVAWTTVTVLVSNDFGRSLLGLKVVAEVAAVALIAATATDVSTRVMLRRLAWSAGAMSVAITVQLASQGALDLLAGGRSDSSLAADVAEVHYSATATSVAVGRSNYAGAIILLGVIALICYWSYIRSRWERAVAIAVAGISVLGIAGTGSKSQLISLGVVLLLAATLRLGLPMVKKGKGRLLAASGVTMMIFVSVAAMWNYLVALFAPLQQAWTSEYGTLGRRFEIWTSALVTIRKNPVFGVGVFDLHLHTSVLDYPTAHNTVLNVAAETGVLGLFIYLWLLFVPIVWSGPPLRRVSLLLISSLFVAGMAEPTLRTGPYDLVAWLFVGSLVAMASPGSISDSMVAPARAVSSSTEPDLVPVVERRIG